MNLIGNLVQHQSTCSDHQDLPLATPQATPNSISRYTHFRNYWPTTLQPRARGVAWLRNVLLLELLLLLMLFLLLSETPDELLLFWPKELFEFWKAVLGVFPFSASTIKMCPIVVTQVIPTRKEGCASRNLASIWSDFAVLGFAMSTEMFWAKK